MEQGIHAGSQSAYYRSHYGDRKPMGKFQPLYCAGRPIERTREELAEVGVPALAGNVRHIPPEGGTPTVVSKPRSHNDQRFDHAVTIVGVQRKGLCRSFEGEAVGHQRFQVDELLLGKPDRADTRVSSAAP